jgi:hypothetical protein
MVTMEQFRRIALGLSGVVEGAHMGHPDFRLNNRIFATLRPDAGRGMVKLRPEQQRAYVDDYPDAFIEESGAWGRQGCTRVLLDAADEDSLGAALTLAWQNLAAPPPTANARRATLPVQNRSSRPASTKVSSPSTSRRRSSVSAASPSSNRRPGRRAGALSRKK